MYAQLGNLQFDAAGPLTGLDRRRRYGYAKHEVVQGKPRLQFTGEDLERLSLSLTFTAALSEDVEADLAALRGLEHRNEAVPLLIGAGELRGRFVVTSVSEDVRETDPAGNVTRATCRVELLEDVAAEGTAAQQNARLAQRNREQARAAARQDIPEPPPDTDPADVPPSTTTRWG